MKDCTVVSFHNEDTFYQPDHAVATQKDGGEKWWPTSISCVGRLCGFGCDVTVGLNLCIDGKLQLGMGKLGVGVYRTEAHESSTDENCVHSMRWLWDKTAEWGYNKGCLAKLVGQAVRAKNKVHQNLSVPYGVSQFIIYYLLVWFS